LRSLKRIFHIFGWFVRDAHLSLDGIYREIRSIILQELDFRTEADNLERIAANFKGRKDVCFPNVLRELSTARIITTEWIDGIKVSDRGRLDQAAMDKTALAKKIVAA